MPGPSAGIPMNAACSKLFDDIKQFKKHKYALFKIDGEGKDKEIVIDFVAPESSTATANDEKQVFEEFATRLVELNLPRYCLYDFSHTSDAGQKIDKLTYIFWSPDSGALTQKMVYASTNDVCKAAFIGLSKYHQCNDKDELQYDEIFNASVKVI